MAYDRMVARGDNKGAGQAAFSIASFYEQREDYLNAETWYRTCYGKGLVDCSKNFIDLILLNKVVVNDPNAIRPFVEIRAVCGSRIAREYALAHYHETPAQLPLVVNPALTSCSPVGPTDRMETNLVTAARRKEELERLAAYYRQHPEETEEAQERGLAMAAALLLGAMVITVAAQPATGPTSAACRNYMNGVLSYPASACDEPSPTRSH